MGRAGPTLWPAQRRPNGRSPAYPLDAVPDSAICADSPGSSQDAAGVDVFYCSLFVSGTLAGCPRGATPVTQSTWEGGQRFERWTVPEPRCRGAAARGTATRRSHKRRVEKLPAHPSKPLFSAAPCPVPLLPRQRRSARARRAGYPGTRSCRPWERLQQLLQLLVVSGGALRSSPGSRTCRGSHSCIRQLVARPGRPRGRVSDGGTLLVRADDTNDTTGAISRPIKRRRPAAPAGQR